MPDFGIFRGFGSKLFSDKLYAGQLPTQLGNITPILLLDLYPNAAAAYSVRKLRIAYTGSAIRVRRSSDNTEQDIGFTGAGGLDTSSLTSFCGSGNGFVTTWYDQSGNGYNATQSTAANQPQIVSSGSIFVDSNGIPRIRGYQSNTTNLRVSFSGSQPYTVFGVVNYISFSMPVAYPYALDMNSIYNAVAIGWYLGYPRINAGNSLYSTTSISINTNYLTYSLLNSTNSAIGINNNLTSGNAGTLNPDIIVLFNAKGNDAAFNGYLSEVIIYSSNQSSNRTGISTNINSYYGIY